MTKWMLLAAAIGSEVTASLSLKAALDNPAWYAVVVIGYLAAFAALAEVLRRGLALGVTYGIWAAMGVMLTAVLSALVFGEALTPLMLGGITLVIAGVLCVEIGSQHTAHPKDSA